MLNGLGDEKIEELEARALEVWDRVYQAWMMNAIEQKTTVGPKVTSLAVSQTWDRFVDTMQKTPGMLLCKFCLEQNILEDLSLFFNCLQFRNF